MKPSANGNGTDGVCSPSASRQDQPDAGRRSSGTGRLGDLQGTPTPEPGLWPEFRRSRPLALWGPWPCCSHFGSTSVHSLAHFRPVKYRYPAVTWQKTNHCESIGYDWFGILARAASTPGTSGVLGSPNSMVWGKPNSRRFVVVHENEVEVDDRALRFFIICGFRGA